MSEQSDIERMRRIWAQRLEAVQQVRSRTDRRGMTTPRRRDPDERAWLLARGELDGLVEVDVPAGGTPNA